MGTTVSINNTVMFDGAGDVFVNSSALNYTPEEIFEMLRLAFVHSQDEMLVASHCSGKGAFSNYWQLSFSEYLELKQKFEAEIVQAKANKTAKKEATEIRRKEYNTTRAQLTLMLLNSGQPYVCTVANCKENQDLTIDHIVPLSKGGTDNLNNLQFMCKWHNSSKGDRFNANHNLAILG